jgi:hypothetical protein
VVLFTAALFGGTVRLGRSGLAGAARWRVPFRFAVDVVLRVMAAAAVGT